jgi:hypothetical protein
VGAGQGAQAEQPSSGAFESIQAAVGCSIAILLRFMIEEYSSNGRVQILSGTCCAHDRTVFKRIQADGRKR